MEWPKDPRLTDRGQIAPMDLGVRRLAIDRHKFQALGNDEGVLFQEAPAAMLPKFRG
jgi:hypothetical protein